MAITIGDAIMYITGDAKGLDKELKQLVPKMKSLAKGLAIGGAAITGAFALAVKAGAKFEQAITNAATVTGKTGKALDIAKKKMSELAKTLGKTTVFSASQAAEAMYDLASKGFDVAAMSLTELQPFLNLAAATQTDLTLTTEILTGNLKAFGLQASDSGHVADVFTKIIGSSAATMNKLGVSMQYVAPIAYATGESIESISALLGVLYDRNIDASMAGTGLANMFTELMSPESAKLQRVMKKLDLKFKDVDVNTRSLSEVLKTLRDAGINAADVMDLFGKRSGKAAITLLGLKDDTGGAATELEKLEEELRKVMSAEDIDMAKFDELQEKISAATKNLEESLNKVGNEADGTLEKMDKLKDTLVNIGDEAKRVADEQLKTMTGRFLLMKSATEALAITISEKLAPALGPVVSALTEIIKSAEQFVTEHPRISGAIIIIAAGLGALMLVLSGIIAAILVVGGAIIFLGGTATAIIAAGIAAIIGLATITAEQWDFIVKKLENGWIFFQDMAREGVKFWTELFEEVIAWVVEKLEIAGEFWSNLFAESVNFLKSQLDIIKFWWQDIFTTIIKWTKEKWDIALTAIEKAFTVAKEKIGEIWGGLKELMLYPIRLALHGIISSLNWVVGLMNKAVSSIIAVVNKIPGVEITGFKIPLIPMPEFAAAMGGVVPRNANVLVGERGAEVLSLPRGSRVTPLPDAQGDGGNNITLNFNVESMNVRDDNDIAEINRGLENALSNSLRALGIA